MTVPVLSTTARAVAVGSDFDELTVFLDWLNVQSMEEVDGIVRVAAGLSDRNAQRYIMDSMLALTQRQEQLAGQFTAQWWEEHDPEKGYLATPSELASLDQLSSEVGWAVVGHGLDEQGMRMALASVIKKHIWGGQRETVKVNSLRRGTMFARIARPDACAFCCMLAGRGAVYYSHDTRQRDRVTGGWVKGKSGLTVTHGRNRKQAMGEKYHDHCRCTLVPEFSSVFRNPPSYMGAFAAQYEQARAKAQEDGLPLTMKSITAVMRAAGHGA